MQKEMYDGRTRDHYKLELSAKTEVIIVSIKFSSGFNQFSKKEVVLPGFTFTSGFKSLRIKTENGVRNSTEAFSLAEGVFKFLKLFQSKTSPKQV